MWRDLEKLILSFNANFERIFHLENEITVYQKLMFNRYDMVDKIQLLFSPFESQLLVTFRSRPCNGCHGSFGLASWHTQTGHHGCGYHRENCKDCWHGYIGWKVVNHMRVFHNFRMKSQPKGLASYYVFIRKIFFRVKFEKVKKAFSVKCISEKENV